MLRQDVLFLDYLRESIRIKPLMQCSLLTGDGTCEDGVKYLLLTAWVLCAVPQKLIWRCQAKAHWLLGVSEWTVSEPLCLIWSVESSFESSHCFYFLQELTLSFLADEISLSLPFKGFSSICFSDCRTFWSMGLKLSPYLATATHRYNKTVSFFSFNINFFIDNLIINLNRTELLYHWSLPKLVIPPLYNQYLFPRQYLASVCSN